ncbi:MAG: DEAD/DEAH box helicase [Hyphomicrobiaceae bacterium]|nr:DEAD/DEAH box helicase [Hyphomicrobiaceae bacterium]
MTQTFDTLGLSKKVTDAVSAAGYTEPTKIQAEAIPLAVKGHDIIGIAQTGTGKTAGFVLPMLTLLEKGRARARMPRTLILEPTRELAAQVNENFEKYGANHRLNVALLIGGVSFEDQNRIIDRGADVLIATPGRLLDHFERGKLLMTGVEILVIDEADRMLDMGFIPDIERICSLLPTRRQTLFFSATMPAEIRKLTNRFLKHPIEIEVARQNSTAETIDQKLVKSGGKPHEKRETLRSLIDSATEMKNAIVFCNRKRDVATLQHSFERHGYNSGALHGDMDQENRTKTLARFRDGDLKILLASDVAARGLDIPDVSHVFNFDVPTHAEDYVHRIGRTGRAGRSGQAFSIVTPADAKYIDAIEKLIGKDIDWLDGAAPKPRREDQSRPAKTPRPEKAPRQNEQRNAKPDHPAKPQQTAKPQQPAKAEPSRQKPAKDLPDSTPFGQTDQIPAFLRQTFAKA